jgi:hypothetical protein
MGCLMKINGIKEALGDIWGELNCGVRRLCLRPSPGVRLLIIMVLIVASSAVNIWFVVGSIYNAGKRDARKEFLKIEHAGKLELQHKSDSVKTIKRIEFKFKKIEN